MERTHTANESFHLIKDTLANVFLLFHWKADAPLNIMTDAYDSAVEAVFQQFVDNTWQHFPISHVNSNQLKLVTAPTIENSLLFICPSNIFKILLKDTSFMSLLIINHFTYSLFSISKQVLPPSSQTLWLHFTVHHRYQTCQWHWQPSSWCPLLYCILVFEPQNDSSFDITYCRALIQMSENGLVAFFRVNAQRFTNTQLQQLSTFATPDVCFDDIYI